MKNIHRPIGMIIAVIGSCMLATIDAKIFIAVTLYVVGYGLATTIK